jgi:hypothetical protein
MNTATGSPDGERDEFLRLHVDVSPWVHDELQAQADIEQITLTEMVHHAVERELRRMAPEGATLVPAALPCRAQWHEGLSWVEMSERYSSTGTRTRIVEATCTDCGRPQTEVRVVYPASRTIRVAPPEPTDTANAPERDR